MFFLRPQPKCVTSFEQITYSVIEFGGVLPSGTTILNLVTTLPSVHFLFVLTLSYSDPSFRFARLIREQTHCHYVLLELLDLCQVHLTEEVRRRRSLSFSTRPAALSVRLGHRPCSSACSCPALEVAVTSGRSEYKSIFKAQKCSLFPT